MIDFAIDVQEILTAVVHVHECTAHTFATATYRMSCFGRWLWASPARFSFVQPNLCVLAGMDAHGAHRCDGLVPEVLRASGLLVHDERSRALLVASA